MKRPITKLVGASIGMGILGDAFNSDGLKQGSQVASSYVPIAVNISAGSTVINMARGLKRRR